MKLLSRPVLGAFLLGITSITFSVNAESQATKPTKNNVEEVVKLELVNVNTANAEQLATLPGIGESRALRIINYREQNGKIKSLEELNEIKGFGERSIAKLKGRVTF
ncbi:ComEA family DNA-binding protein [Pseudoalteromonas spongiae]|uniref:ComEA family DNA-binding protein n=1 Tax=Pseudoalteromonas spongiae TaxID=298657 RepID=UPI003735FF86